MGIMVEFIILGSKVIQRSRSETLEVGSIRGSIFPWDHGGNHEVKFLNLDDGISFYLWIMMEVNILGSAVIQRSHLQTLMVRLVFSGDHERSPFWSLRLFRGQILNFVCYLPI